MRIGLFVIITLVCSSSWSELCKLPLQNDENIDDVFRIGDAYQIMSGNHFRNLKKKEISEAKKLLWHSWIEIFSHKGCIYSFGLAADLMGGPVEISTPDQTVESCYSNGLDCLNKLANGQEYKAGDKLTRLTIAPTETDGCRYVCQGITSFIHSSHWNGNYPVFNDLRHGNLNHDQLEIIRWLIRNKSRTNKIGIRFSEVPFKYSFACSLPGARGVKKLRHQKNPDLPEQANCRTFASDFHYHPGEILEELKKFKH